MAVKLLEEHHLNALNESMDDMGILQCVVLYGAAGVFRVVDHVSEFEMVQTHFQDHFYTGLMTKENTRILADSGLIDTGGYLDIIFDGVNCIKHLLKIRDQVDQDIHEEDMVYEIKKVEAKLKVTEYAHAERLLARSNILNNPQEPDHADLVARIDTQMDQLAQQKHDLLHHAENGLLKRIKDLEEYSDARERREKRLRWFLAATWVFLFARSVMSNTPLLLLYLGAVFSLPALAIAMFVKGICCEIERRKIKEQLKQNEISCQDIQNKIDKLMDTEGHVAAGNAHEFNSLMLRHAMRCDEHTLLTMSEKQMNTNKWFFFKLAGLCAVAAVVSAFCPPLAGTIIVSVAFVMIGLYVIPMVRQMRARKALEHESLTNIAEVRASLESGALVTLSITFVTTVGVFTATCLA